VIEIGCPAFVPLIEAGDLASPALRAAAKAYLEPLLEARVDTIVLGCTHYPLLRPLLAELLPPDVELINPAVAAAQRLGPLLASLGDAPEAERQGDPEAPPLQRTRFCVTGPAESFAKAAATWLGSIPQVQQVDLRSLARAF
jgi:glutamate racemase